MNQFSKITRKGSKTFYTASLFFPKEIRTHIHIIYAYVRTIDDLIDQPNPDIHQYNRIKKETLNALRGQKISSSELIKTFVSTFQTFHMEQTWLLAFFKSQEMDSTKKRYKTFSDLEEYMYGVAEVIGLMMSAVMGIPKKAYPYAQKLGKSMQLLNIIRDISEDSDLNRVYIPKNDLQKFSLQQIRPNSTNTQQLVKLIRYELARFYRIHTSAYEGFAYIPEKFRTPIIASYTLYLHVANTINQEPLIIYRKKVKPNYVRIGVELLNAYVQNSKFK